MVLLDDNIETPTGIMFRGAVKIIRKAGSRYVIQKDGLTAYAYSSQLRFIKYSKGK